MGEVLLYWAQGYHGETRERMPEAGVGVRQEDPTEGCPMSWALRKCMDVPAEEDSKSTPVGEQGRLDTSSGLLSLRSPLALHILTLGELLRRERNNHPVRNNSRLHQSPRELRVLSGSRFQV